MNTTVLQMYDSERNPTKRIFTGSYNENYITGSYNENYITGSYNEKYVTGSYDENTSLVPTKRQTHT